jgi:hypothetical protein
MTPMLAEIADKMPTLRSVWVVGLLIGLIAAAVTVGLSLARLWLGAIVILGALAIGVLAAWPGSMDEHILRELGVGYLRQQRIAAFAPCMLAIGAWIILCFIRRANRTLSSKQR